MYYDILNLPLMFYALVSLLVPFDAIMTRNQRRALSFAFAFVLSLLFMGPVARSFLQYDTSLFQIAQIVREHSDETDKITVCGNADSVYLFSERQSVSKYSYQTPVCFLVKSQQSEQMREEYFRDLKTKKPKLIVLPPTEKFKAYSEVKEIMGDHYRLLEVIDGIEIYLLTQ